MSAYALINVMLRQKAWDPYPFILLNLFLSMLAAIQAPVIMMSQNRQDTKDRLRSELDFEVNRRSELEIQGLARKLNLLDEKIDDVGSLLRVEQSRERGSVCNHSIICFAGQTEIHFAVRSRILHNARLGPGKENMVK